MHLTRSVDVLALAYGTARSLVPRWGKVGMTGGSDLRGGADEGRMRFFILPVIGGKGGCKINIPFLDPLDGFGVQLVRGGRRALPATASIQLAADVMKVCGALVANGWHRHLEDEHVIH